MANKFSSTRLVEFCDTDAAGIVHFSAFVCYMEQAEHAFLRHLGTSVVRDLGDGWHLSWPRVHVECDYSGTARFEDSLEIQLQVSKLGTKSVSYSFEFRNSETVIAKGAIAAVCCRVRSGFPLESVPIPEDLRQKLSPYLISPDLNS